MSPDARAAVLMDSSGDACAARELLRAVGRAAEGPSAELEAQVVGGSVYAVRGSRWTLVTVARRSALSSLMLYDMRALLRGLEAA
jgi:hypothetical protein